ncbi:NADPH2:quinone reductase [Pararhizobium capsulatum DSM 1112]|uniref:NADPH2:quinone reductase n=1 Tax=Pararhizobium capsulatum DSM 1112 TaxID=1121113 RepID=A0ABU0C1N2_9HYPH|nr:zinc-binding dehydrogenase [Pararhizobium capsulatum]MDQ0324098.1 NADPH2:quinone reductase [Pararhizobium capsulatum DSM 1112]
MRAILLEQPGEAPGVLRIADIAPPVGGRGDIVVAVACCGCNFADTMMWRGTYPHPARYPLVPGYEIAGTVIAIGAAVQDFSVGDRVAGYAEAGGGFAEFCVVPAAAAIRLPDSVHLETAAAFLIQAQTAWHLLHTVSTIRPGDVVLIHAIGGGVGLYLTQLAIQAGAAVVGTVGTPGKQMRALEYGASLVVNRGEADFVGEIRSFLDGRYLDKIYDSTGATILDRSFSLLRPLGQIVSYGEAEGRPLDNLWARLVEKSGTFSRFHLGHLDFTGQAWRDGLSLTLAAVADGTLRVPVERIFSFEQAQQMYECLESRMVSGKLLLAVNPNCNQ